MTWQTEDEDPAGAGLPGLLRLYETGLAHLERVKQDDLEAQVEHLQSLAGKLALGRRTLRIYDAVKFVPPDRRAHLERLGCVVRGREIKGAERETVVRVDLHGRPYVLTFREPPASQEEVLAYLDIHDGDGRGVFTVLLAFDINEPGDGWVPRRIDAFVPGNWVRDLLDFSVRLETGGGAGGQNGPSAQPDDLRKRFGLGGT